MSELIRRTGRQPDAAESPVPFVSPGRTATALAEVASDEEADGDTLGSNSVEPNAIPASPESAKPVVSPALIWCALFVVYIVWGSTYVAIQWAVETMPPFLTAGMRFVTAGGIMLAVLRVRDRTPITAAHVRGAGLVGTLMLLGGNGLVCWAEKHVPSGIAAVMIATAPLWFVVLDWLVYRGPRPTLAVSIGAIIGFIGVVLLINPGGVTGGVHVGGAIALLCACALWPLGSLHSRRIALPSSVFVSTALQMVCGGASLLVVGSLLGEWPRVDLSAITLRSWLSFGYLLVFGSMIAFSCYVWLLRIASPALISTYAYVNPVVAVLLGTTLNHEPLSQRTLIGAAVIVVAVIIVTTASRPKAVRR